MKDIYYEFIPLEEEEASKLGYPYYELYRVDNSAFRGKDSAENIFNGRVFYLKEIKKILIRGKNIGHATKWYYYAWLGISKSSFTKDLIKVSLDELEPIENSISYIMKEA